jgi:hypothetical protein
LNEQNRHQRFGLVAQNTQLMWPLGVTPLGAALICDVFIF